MDVEVQFGDGIAPPTPVADGYHVVEYSGREGSARFLVDPDGRRVDADWAPDCSVKRAEDLTALLLGPILGALLRLRGRLSLHASVVNVSGQAVALAGRGGAGKSTLAAALAARGHAVLADDVAALDRDPQRGWIAYPGYARLRVSPETLPAFGSQAVDAGPVLTRQDKRYIGLTNGPGGARWRFQAEPLPLAAVYLLERDPDAAHPAVERLDKPERVGALLAQLRPSPFPLDRGRRRAELAGLAELVEAVEVRRLRCPEGLARVEEICEVLAGDAAGREA